ncbi:MAG: DUF3305 domain-containing protein [bacterium]|nr:DUF3305 domain-containing protein [bacterium]
MKRSKTIPIGVIMAKEVFDNPWVDHIWKANGIALEFPSEICWKKLSSSEKSTHYIVSSELQLFRGETESYLSNINDKEPSIYVILRENDDSDDDASEETSEDVPLEVHLVTASPFEAQDYLDTGEDIVERIPLPDVLLDQITAFIAEHHQEEKFRKRKRDKLDVQEHKFGQEPIFETKQRMSGSINNDDKKS